MIVSSAMPLCVALHFKKEKAVKVTPVPEEAPAGECRRGVNDETDEGQRKSPMKTPLQLFPTFP